MTGVFLIVMVLILGRVLRLPRQVVGLVVAILWIAMLSLQVVAPGSAAAATFGGSAAGWLVLGALVVLVAGYRRLLRGLRLRAAGGGGAGTPGAGATPGIAGQDPDAPLSEAELDRYARQLVLRQLGGPGQMRLRRARVLVVGAGGLGAPICLYLAAAGVGRITLADDDTVSLSNLQRQVIFRDDLRGEPKAYAAAEAMMRLNPHVDVTPLVRRVTEADTALIADHDLVLDGSDSFAGRAAVNRACVAAGVPLVWGALAQWEGQVSLFDPARGGPCMACLFPHPPERDAPCAEAGVVGALPGIIGSVMALEAIKQLTGAGRDLRGRMMLFDGLYGETRMIDCPRDPGCPVCGAQSALEPARAPA